MHANIEDWLPQSEALNNIKLSRNTQGAKVMTHAGRAHCDDLMTTATLLATVPSMTVLRSSRPTEADLDDPTIWVVDQGCSYCPEMSNYDHHQIDRDSCAFSLLLDALGVYPTAASAWPWLNAFEAQDHGGLAALARHLQVPSGKFAATIVPMLSPVEKLMLDTFGTMRRIQPGDFMHATLVDMGRGILTQLRMALAEFAACEEAAELIYMPDGCGILVDVAPEIVPEFGLRLWARRTYPEAQFVLHRERSRGFWGVHTLVPIQFGELPQGWRHGGADRICAVVHKPLEVVISEAIAILELCKKQSRV